MFHKKVLFGRVICQYLPGTDQMNPSKRTTLYHAPQGYPQTSDLIFSDILEFQWAKMPENRKLLKNSPNVKFFDLIAIIKIFWTYLLTSRRPFYVASRFFVDVFMHKTMLTVSSYFFNTINSNLCLVSKVQFVP